VGEGKKVYQLEYVVEEQLMVVLSGKQRHVRLIPVRALDGDDVEWIKVAETKGCITFATGVMRRSAQLVYCLCVAIKRQVCGTCNMHGEARNMYKTSGVCSEEIAAVWELCKCR
jgi:serine/threonine-protein kinase MRCK